MCGGKTMLVMRCTQASSAGIGDTVIIRPISLLCPTGSERGQDWRVEIRGVCLIP
jgi:hypothetical protein